MKKFILFQWGAYDAFGGLNDIKGDFDTLEEAVAAAQATKYWDTSEVVDRDTWSVVWENPEDSPQPTLLDGINQKA